MITAEEARKKSRENFKDKYKSQITRNTKDLISKINKKLRKNINKGYDTLYFHTDIHNNLYTMKAIDPEYLIGYYKGLGYKIKIDPYSVRENGILSDRLVISWNNDFG